MKLKEAIQLLKEHNLWRRYDGKIGEGPKMIEPEKLGIAIDKVVNKFENSCIYSVSEMFYCMTSNGYDGFTKDKCKEQCDMCKSGE